LEAARTVFGSAFGRGFISQHVHSRSRWVFAARLRDPSDGNDWSCGDSGAPQIGIDSSLMLKNSMALTLDEVEHNAVLARVRLTAEEKSQLTEQLDQILGHMEKLKQLDTSNVEPFSHAVDPVNALREDRVTNRPDPDALLANAPEHDTTFFRVPKIIE
jgi:aspartyl-tRNA(Asn)/glutamyl-tRNA(Gln) amidotransferase subunit C